jgi:hypothetical protein
MKTLLKGKRQKLVDWIKSKKKSDKKKVVEQKIDYEGIRLLREYYIDKDDETHLFI